MGRDILSRGLFDTFMSVSTHAPAWGATHDLDALYKAGGVSTHAPAWGATITDVSSSILFHVFQPTRPHGARHSDLSSNGKRIKFQPTRPHGARQGAPVDTPRRMSFNPRARMGRDTFRRLTTSRISHVSTHAPAWGATQHQCQQYLQKLFQPTRPHGARR